VIDLTGRPLLPRDRNTAIHDWNSGRLALSWDCEARGFDIYVPKVDLVYLKSLDGVQAMIDWVIGNLQILPEAADFVLLIGGVPARPRRLLRGPQPPLDAPFAAIPKALLQSHGLVRRMLLGKREVEIIGGSESLLSQALRSLVEWSQDHAIEPTSRLHPMHVLDVENAEC
jgi:hypothetical protein